MSEGYDVFISYHGGGGDESLSSYPYAEAFYNYLTEHGFSAFLYKKSPIDDFYDAINEGILNSRNFVLIASRAEMLSEWVRDELKQFDGLRKIGRKKGAIITACLFDSITEADLYEFNTTFVTKDIVRGKAGFSRILCMLTGGKSEVKMLECEEDQDPAEKKATESQMSADQPMTSNDPPPEETHESSKKWGFFPEDEGKTERRWSFFPEDEEKTAEPAPAVAQETQSEGRRWSFFPDETSEQETGDGEKKERKWSFFT